MREKLHPSDWRFGCTIEDCQSSTTCNVTLNKASFSRSACLRAIQFIITVKKIMVLELQRFPRFREEGPRDMILWCLRSISATSDRVNRSHATHDKREAHERQTGQSRAVVVEAVDLSGKSIR